MRAVDVPTIRDEMLRFYATRDGLDKYLSMCGRLGLAGCPAAPEVITQMWRAEMETLRSGEMFYVSSDMTHLAISAGATMPAFELRREDLPADHGLMVFDEPIAAWEEDGEHRIDGDRRTPIKAASWSVGADPRSGLLGLYMCIYSARDLMPGMPGHLPRLLHDNEMILPFREFDLPTDGSIADLAARYVLAAWVLMAQPGIAAVHQHEPTAQERSGLKRRREKYEPVRVVTLRYAPSGGGQAGAREYRHRWAVRGHWRRQWYPSRSGHLPIWISPYIKGPDGAPLKTGEKVYAWVR